MNKEKPLHITVGNVLLIILILLITITGSLVYYIASLPKAELELYNDVENVIEDETVKNMIDSAQNVISVANNTINNNISDKEIMNENLVVLYNGLLLDVSKMGRTNLQYIDALDKYKDKYVITYYNYENFSFKEAKLGVLFETGYENSLAIDEVSKIAISESYNAIPQEIKVVNAIPNLVLEKNPTIAEFDSKKIIISDLDGNGTQEYILILANTKTGYSKIMLADTTGVKVADLAYIEKSEWESVTTEEFYLSLSNVEVIDIDNDNIMEIVIEIPSYEGEPDVSLLKYKNGEILGDTNIECSILP